MAFQPGDRVRIRRPDSEYTGCRGHVVDDPGGRGASLFGCWIAIAVWLWRARPEDLEAHARLALEGDDASPKENEPGADPRA